MTPGRQYLVAFLLPVVPYVAASAIDLQPVPRPNLEAMEPAVRTQLSEAREVLDELIAGEPEPGARLAATFGELGELYLLYELEEAASAALANAHRLEPGEFRWRYLLGVVAQRRGELDIAVERFGAALELRPRDLATLIRLGQVELARGRTAIAATRFETALEVDPESAAALDGLGQALARLGEIANAVQRFRAALRRRPDAGAVHYHLGLAYRELGRLEEARRHLQRRSDDEVPFPDPIVAAISNRAAGTGLHMVRGNYAVVNRDLAAAAEHYRRALAADPDYLRARRALASTLSMMGEHDGALDEYRQVLERDPGDALAHYNIGTIHTSRGEPAAAIPHFERAVDAAPDFAEARINLALALQETGRIEEATARAREAAELAPEDREGRLLAAELLARSGRFGDAAEEFDAAIHLGADDEQVHFGHAMALLLDGDARGARRRLEASLAERPDSLPLRHLLARLLATAGPGELRDGERSLDLAREVFERRPRIDHAETVAMALAELGRHEEAARWQERIIERARQRGLEELIPRLERRLAAYRRGEPIREPWVER